MSERRAGITRRRMLVSVPALGGLLVTGCSDTFRPPVVRSGLIGAADVLTMSTSRWLQADQPLAREYGREHIAPEFPTWGQTNPDDERYQPLFGNTVTTPVFGVEVPVKAHELADPEKGTGVAMICTFGDTTDVIWWRELDLAPSSTGPAG